MILGVVVASFIGSIVSMIWLFFSKRATKFYIKDSMNYLRLILLCFVLPIIPFLLHPICKNISNESYINLNNPMMDQLIVLIEIWLFFIIMLLIYRLFHYCRMCKMSRESIRIQDESVLLKLEYWKQVLGIQKDIRISHNTNVCSPAILYHKGYQILFPVFEMTDYQMEVALLHELVHLKNRDIMTKDACFFVQMLHGWNPLIYFLKKSITRWAEVLCDLKVCELGKEVFSEKDYYYTIVEMMELASEERAYDVLFCLFEKESLLRFRIDKFKLARQTKQCGRKRIFIATAVFVLGLSVSVLVTMQHGLYAWHEDSLSGFEKEMQKTEVKINTDESSIFLDVSETYCDIHDFGKALDDKKVLDKNELWEIWIKQDDIVVLDIFIFTDSQSYVVGYKTNKGTSYFNGSETSSYTFEDETIESIFIKNCGRKAKFDIAANADG